MGDLPVQGKVTIELGPAPRLLIIKPSSLGDIVHSLPVLAALKKRYPDSVIHWAVFKGLDGLLEGHPFVDKLIIIDKKSMSSGAMALIGGLVRLRGELRGNRYDAAIDLQGLLRSAVVSFISGAKKRVGFSDAREGAPFFYTDKIAGGKALHAVDRYMKIASMLGCDSKAEFPMVEDVPTLPFDGDYAVIVPGARWRTKIWPAEKFGELALRMTIRSIVLGGPEDMEKAEKIVSLSGGNAISMAGKTTLRELSGIIKGARYMVTNDTGPMHIAAAYNIPVIAIFGPTSHVRTGPYGDNNTVLRAEMDCAPCYSRKCPDLRCMESVGVQDALDAISNNNLQ